MKDWSKKLYRKVPKMVQPWVFYQQVDDFGYLALYRRQGEDFEVEE